MKRFLIFAQSALKSCPQRSRDPSAWSQTVSCSWSKQQSCHSWRWLGDKMSLTRGHFFGDHKCFFHSQETNSKRIIPDQTSCFLSPKPCCDQWSKSNSGLHGSSLWGTLFHLGLCLSPYLQSWALCWCWRFAKAMSFKTKTSLLSTSTCACLLSSPFYVQASPIYLWTTSVLIKTFWVKKSCYVNVAIFTWSYLWTCVLPLRLSICLSTVQMICLLWFYRPTLPIYRPHSI